MLHGYARYQNDNNNPNNPSNPPAFVTLGEETTDEMMLFFYSYLIYEEGDENITMAGGGHLEHHSTCQTPVNVGVEDIEGIGNIDFYPNPVTKDMFHVKLVNSNLDEYQLELTDVSGKQVMLKNCNGDCDIQIPVSITNGFYIAAIKKDGVVLKTEKVVLMR